MVHISEHINSSNHKIRSYGQISKMVVNLISKKLENKNSSTCQLRCLNNSLLIIIVDTPENHLSNIDQKSYVGEVHT